MARVYLTLHHHQATWEGDESVFAADLVSEIWHKLTRLGDSLAPACNFNMIKITVIMLHIMVYGMRRRFRWEECCAVGAVER